MNTETPALAAEVVAALRSQLRGSVLLPHDDGYAAARRVWNAAIDRRPSAIATCADAEDVAVTLRIAARHGAPVTVRGGGHNVAGRSLRDGAVLLDLSRLRGVEVNAAARVAAVQGGALWRDVDAATARAGLAITGGLISSTGVGGFTLGGGAGWLMRRHSLACDNLLAATVILADGRVVRASPDEQPDLFWGLRGGAGGLGVVTSFEFSAHPLRDVLAGVVVHPAGEALDVLRAFRDFAAGAPDEFCGLAALVHAPPLPFLDPAWHGRPAVLLALCWCGELAAGERALAPLRAHGRPVAEHVGTMPYVQWQQLQDANAPAGLYNYWKTANYRRLDDATLVRLAAAAQQLPTRRSEIHIQHMGGAVARVPHADTAFAHRDAGWFVNLIGIAESADALPPMRDRVRALHAELADGALAGILPNFSDQDDGQAERQFGGDVAARLAALRRRYDPAGLLA